MPIKILLLKNHSCKMNKTNPTSKSCNHNHSPTPPIQLSLQEKRQVTSKLLIMTIILYERCITKRTQFTVSTYPPLLILFYIISLGCHHLRTTIRIYIYLPPSSKYYPAASCLWPQTHGNSRHHVQQQQQTLCSQSHSTSIWKKLPKHQPTRYSVMAPNSGAFPP